ncbi:MAG: hypothetical protein L6U99_06125 [Clostridium sp.]|nr:MAG: hypothetical protein L6U99_06125 [Clostridium sp.]
MFGTGILRIKQLYQNSSFKPEFKIYDNSLTIILPSLNIKPNVTVDEAKIIDYLKKGMQASSNDLAVVTGFSKDKVLKLIKSLQAKGYIKVLGIGKATRYSI